ncbi:MAG: SH3 domain-containing protein [Pseudomonadota bacterium]
MNRLLLILSTIILAVSVVALASCGRRGSPKYTSVSPQMRMNLLEGFRRGDLILDCETKCLRSHLNARKEQHSKFLNGQYEELAVSVMQIGLNRDLPYFYLGICAENLGYLDAAEKYYDQSLRLLQNGLSIHRCNDASNCNGINLDVELPKHILVVKRIKQELAQAVEPKNNYNEESLDYSGKLSTPNSSKYDVDTVDGQQSEKYQKRLKQQQKDKGMPPAGQLDNTTRNFPGKANKNVQAETVIKNSEPEQKLVPLAMQRKDEHQTVSSPPAEQKEIIASVDSMKTEKHVDFKPKKDFEASAQKLSNKNDVQENSSSSLPKATITQSTTMMAEPSVMSDSICDIPNGTTVALLEEKSNFFKILFNNKEGFVHSNFIRKSLQ